MEKTLDVVGNPLEVGDKVVYSFYLEARLHIGYVAHIGKSRVWVCNNEKDCKRWSYENSIHRYAWPLFFRKDASNVMKC